MGEPKNQNFQDFGILNVSPSPKHQYYLSFETPGYLKKSPEESWDILKNNICTTLNISEKSPILFFCGKDGHRQMMKIRLTSSGKSWI